MILLLHNHDLTLAALSTVLGESAILPVSNVDEAVRIAKQGKCELGIVEPLQHPGCVKALAPYLRVIVLTSDETAKSVVDAVTQGAIAYLPVSCGLDELVNAVNKAKQGVPTLDALSALRIIKRMDADRQGSANEVIKVRLTERQHQALTLVCQGLSNQEIADRIGISYWRVLNINAAVYRKLGVSGKGPGRCRLAAVEWARTHGIG